MRQLRTLLQLGPDERPGVRARRRGWAMVAWLLPQVFLGTWLLVVPDRVTFTLNQLAALAHVALALLLLPVIAFWLWSHARAARPRQLSAAASGAPSAGLLLVLVGACASGGAVLYYGRVGAAAWAHAALGMCVAFPLAAHVWSAGRRRAAWALAAMVPLAAGAGWVARRAVPPLPLDPVTPRFAYETRPAALYESAEWCGRCHAEVFAEWRRSLHSRTFELPQIRDDLARFPELLRLDVRDFGRVMRTGHGQPIAPVDGHAIGSFENCILCHAPASFFGDDPSDAIRAPSRQSADAVSCSYCHTLRAVRPGSPPPERFARRIRADGARAFTDGLGPLSEQEFTGMMAMAVSAPETVRRYLGQGSESRAAQAVAELLIRWRPDMHRRDYRPAVLGTSEACAVCHGITEQLWTAPHQEYATWAASPLAHGPADRVVHCQDCHMAREMTGGPTREPGRVTAWSPERPRRRSHWFLGGNVRAQATLGDPDMARRAHALNRDAVRVRVLELRREGDRLVARLEVTNHHTGHVFPASEDGFRPAWVRLRAVSPTGATVAAASPLRERGQPPSPEMILRIVDRAEHRVVHDTTLLPGASRVFDTSLELPRGAAVATVVAEVFHALDPEAIAAQTVPAP